MNIKDKVAIVTGGASGLGVANGGKVLIMDLNMERGKAIVAELGKDKVIFDKTDVTSESQVKEAIARAIREFGTIDICINCAGIGVAQKTVSGLSMCYAYVQNKCKRMNPMKVEKGE